MPDRNSRDTGDIKCTRVEHKANRGLPHGPHLSRNCGVVRANDDQCGRNISTLQTAQIDISICPDAAMH